MSAESSLISPNSLTSIASSDSPAYLTALNPEQRAAVEAIDGPVLVLAGAGTGKTRVLTTRIAHILMQRKAFPGQILAVTFTNKAAGEMKERVEHLLGISTESDTRGSTSGIWLGTFHSIGAKILRRHAELVGLTPAFTILDDDDQQRVIKALLAEMNLDAAEYPPRMLLAIIQSWKDRGLKPEKVTAAYASEAIEVITHKLYHNYQARLRALNACDFGDLLLHNLTLFSEHPHIAQEYAQRFRYILVDEYQDTNVAQYLWLRLLALGHHNLCCVGDDDQSIYGWRGAEVGNILRFEKDFPECITIRLERNYRSTRHILGAASGLITNNKSRLGKTLWTESDGGHKVRIKSVWDDGEEARFVGEEVEALQRDKTPLTEMAILVRAGYQTRAFEERFITLGVPYRVVGGLRFYERQEIRDAIAYLRLVSQPNDDLAYERIINTPRRGIGKATLEQIHLTARTENCSLMAAMDKMLSRDELKGKTGFALQAFSNGIRKWREAQSAMPLTELTDLVLEESGYRAMWQADKTPEAPGRLENLKELVRAMGEFENLGGFLEHVSLVFERTQETGVEMISIMSLHAAKGLEFDAVFLTGWEEGLFPSQRTMDEKGTAGLEEERRLAYVGITRAKKLCTISHAANRRIYNQWQASVPSRFLEELPEENLELLEGGTNRRSAAQGPKLWQKGIDTMLDEFRLAATQGSNHTTPRHTLNKENPASQSSASSFRKGSHVVHESFGNGVVLNITGDHLTVAFKNGSTKRILAEYVKLVR